jgi:cytochrome c oxidase assembly factor CtaG/putative copper export protein
VADPEQTPTAPPHDAAAAEWPRRGEVVQWVLGLGLITGIALWMALSIGNGVSPPSSVGDPGRLTAWALPVLDLLVNLSGVVTVGLLLVGAFLLPAPGGELAGLALRAHRWAARAALAWALLVATQAVFTVSEAFGLPVSELSSRILFSYLTDTTPGKAALWQVGLALAVALGARWALRSREAVWLLGLAVVAMSPPALTGHSASSSSHTLASVSLMFHIVPAALWVGGLLGLVWVAARGSRRLGLAVSRFSHLAVWCVVILAVSGFANAAVRMQWGDLLTSSYGSLVLAKATALLTLGGFGWLHRQHTLPRLEPPAPERAGQETSVRRAFVSLALVELAVMGATIAIAAALSHSPPPPKEAAEIDPTVELIGHALPAAPTPWRLLTDFGADGVGMALVGLAGALYLTGLWTLRRRGDAWPIGRTLAFGAGLVVLAWSTFGGLGAYSHVLFSAHMGAHMMLSMVVPILLVLGAPITLALRTLPGARVPGELGPRQILLGILQSRVVRVLAHPVVAVAQFVIGLYAVYFTGLFGWLMENHWGHVAMQLHFLLSGLWLFWVIVGIDPAPHRLAPLWRFGLLMIVMPFHAFFSVTLMSYETVIGVDYWRLIDRPYRTDLLQDQYLGGSLSWGLGEVPIVLVLVALFVGWVRSDAREARRVDRAADRDGDEGALQQYNAWLAKLNAADRDREERADRS